MRAIALLAVLALFTSIAFAAHPTQSLPVLVSSSGENLNSDNFTCYNQSTSDPDGNEVLNMYAWLKNGASTNENFPESIVFNLPFDTSTSPTVDFSGKSHTGTVSGAAWNSSGKFGGAFTFGGADSIEVADNSDLEMRGPDAAMELWVNPSTACSATSCYLLIKYYSAGSEHFGYLLYIDSCTTVWFNTYYSLASKSISKSAPDICDGNWHHVVVMNDVGGNVYRIFVDGVAGSSDSNAYGGGTGANLLIGASYYGSIDNVIKYNRTLSADEILARYNAHYNKVASQDVSVGDTWQCSVTPYDSEANSPGQTLQSNGVTINWDGNLLAMLNISHTCSCGTNVSTTGISFGSLTAGQVSTIQSLNFTNLGSGPTTDTTIEGTTWNASLTQGFGENYTKWSLNNAFNYADGTSIATGNPSMNFNLTNNESKLIYFRVQVPLGTSRGAYNQTLTLTTWC